MEKSISKNLVASVRAYLAGIGHPVTNVQGYEIVARAQGFENKHAYAAAKGSEQVSAVPFVKKPQDPELSVVDGVSYITFPDNRRVRFFNEGDAPMTVQEMKAANWRLKAVIPMDTSVVGNIDASNEQASQRITGTDYALCDISYEVVPYFYGNDAVAMLVSGVIEDPDQVFELGEDDAVETPVADGSLMPQKDLIRLAGLLALAKTRQIVWYTTLHDGVPHEHKVVWDGDSEFDFARILANLHEMKYFADNGQPYSMRIDNHDVEINFDSAMHEMVFEHIDTVLQGEEEDGMFLHIEDIAYGRRVGDKVWQFTDFKGEIWRLGFDRAGTYLGA